MLKEIFPVLPVLYVYLYCISVGYILMGLFAQRRFSLRMTVLLITGTVMIMMVINILAWQALGMMCYVRFFPLINHIPLFFFAALISHARGLRLLFQMLSCVLFCYFILHASLLLYFLCGQQWLVVPVGILLFTFLIIFCFFRYIRPLYQEIMDQLTRGWTLICLVLAFYYVMEFVVITDFVGDSLFATITKPAFTFMTAMVYGLIFFLFTTVRREAAISRSHAIATLQVSALRDRIEASQQAEERIRIERHDLRHRLNTLTGLLETGDTAAALAYIQKAQEQIDQTVPARWCTDPVLNAVCSIYFQQAASQHIVVSADLSFPDPLPVDVSGLSVVLANALENAITACKALPEADRRIICRSIAYPRLMLHIANPFTGTIAFDASGLPMATDKGHGIGIRSIKTFCDQYNALLTCTAEAGWFTLRIAF